MFGVFEVKVADGVALVTMNRPPANAMSREVYTSLGELIDWVERSDDVRALVLAGSPESRAWIGGGDLNEFLTLTPETRGERHEYVEGISDRFHNLSCPTIAAIERHAIGGGMVIASFCDIRIAADTALFGMPEVDRSLTGGAGAYFNRLAIPIGFIREMVFTGRRFSAAELDKVGFLNHVLPQDQILPKAMEIATVIAGKSAPAVKAIKESVNLIDHVGWNEGRAKAHARSVQLVGTEDYKEGITAFLERRKPVIRHR